MFLMQFNEEIYVWHYKLLWRKRHLHVFSFYVRFVPDQRNPDKERLMQDLQKLFKEMKKGDCKTEGITRRLGIANGELVQLVQLQGKLKNSCVLFESVFVLSVLSYFQSMNRRM